MSCSGTDGADWVDIASSISCPVECVLQPGESGKHEIAILNFGALAANFSVSAKCDDPLLYSDGQRTWAQTYSVKPARRRRPFRDHRTIDFPVGTVARLGRSGMTAHVQVVIKRLLAGAPTGVRPEKVADMTLQLRLLDE